MYRYPYFFVNLPLLQYVTEDLSGNKNMCGFSVTVKGNFRFSFIGRLKQSCEHF